MENGTVLGILIACFAVSLVIMYSMLGGLTVEAQDVDLTGLATTEDLAIIYAEIVAISAPVDGSESATEQLPAFDGEFILTKAEFEDEATEAEALRLAIESVESRDFKKAVFEALLNYNVDIESYKDITEIVNVEDADVKNNNKVEFDLKVYYFIEGDEDEAYKSRLDDFKVKVRELDFDDDFEDAEVDEDYLDNLVVKYSREL